jgi:hypothetical protein
MAPYHAGDVPRDTSGRAETARKCRLMATVASASDLRLGRHMMGRIVGCRAEAVARNFAGA